jgi:dinuclear metal center YbgI/SA1388 family protein
MPSSPVPSPTPQASVNLASLVAYLNAFLDIDRGRDYGPNGLQVDGAAQVSRLAVGVSACEELFVRAHQAGAQAVLVHHGIFWDGQPLQLTGYQFQRVAALVRRDLSLIAYHIPLDRHPELGNNILAARGLGLEDNEPFGEIDGEMVGFRGRFPNPIPAAELVARCTALFKREPLSFLAGQDSVATVGIISGGAQKQFAQAIAQGLDAYITGEVSEYVMNMARESRTHYLSAGHYATEVLGVQALGAHVAERFGIDVEFIDVPNPV